MCRLKCVDVYVQTFAKGTDDCYFCESAICLSLYREQMERVDVRKAHGLRLRQMGRHRGPDKRQAVIQNLETQKQKLHAQFFMVNFVRGAIIAVQV